MKNISFALFSLGITIGIIGGSKAPATDQTWPDTLPVFAFGVALAIIALIFWWKAERKATASLANLQKDNLENPISLLYSLKGPLSLLCDEAPEIELEDIRNRVQIISEEILFPVSENRSILISQMGMEAGSNILIIFAYCERMLNRAWSASADGHRGETVLALEEAQQALGELILELPSQ